MKAIFFSTLIFFTTLVYCLAQEQFQLAPPLMKFQSIFFKKSHVVELLFAQPGTAIHYTLNGNEPEEKDPVYTKPILVKKNFTTIKAKVFGENFLPSETIEAVFVKEGLPLSKVIYTEPDKKYSGSGENTLMDNKGGIKGFNQGTWLGFQNDTVLVTIELPRARKVKSVLVDMLQDQGSWIFFPKKTEVYGRDHKTGYFEKLGEIYSLPVQGKDLTVCKPLYIDFKKKMKTNSIQLKFFVLKSIPEWHPGQGKRSWVFIDEVKLY